MKKIIFFTFIIILFSLLNKKVNCYFFDLEKYDNSSIITIENTNNKNYSYKINLISDYKTNSEIISITNKYFYYYNKEYSEISTILNDYPVIYFEELSSFYSITQQLYKSSNSRWKKIPAIIINISQNNSHSYNNNTSLLKDFDYLNKMSEIILFFSYNNNEEFSENKNNDYSIKKNFSSNKIKYNTFITIKIRFTEDIIRKRFSIFLLIFLLFLSLYWTYLFHKAKKRQIKLFVHSVLLWIVYINLINSLIFTYWTFNYPFDHQEGFIYNLFRFFNYLSKFLPILCGTFQLNIIELREHFDLMRNKKSPLIYGVLVFFIFTSEGSFLLNLGDNQNESLIETSECLNLFIYFIIFIGATCTYCRIRKVIFFRIRISILDQPLYIPALRIKRKMVNKHIFCIYFDIFLIYFIFFIFNHFFWKYRNMRLIMLYTRFSEVLMMIMLMIAYYPINIPDHYIEEGMMGNDERILEELDLPPDFFGPGKFESIYMLDKNFNEKRFLKKKENKDLVNLVIVLKPFGKLKPNINKIKNINKKNLLNDKNDNSINNNNNGNNDIDKEIKISNTSLLNSDKNKSENIMKECDFNIINSDEIKDDINKKKRTSLLDGNSNSDNKKNNENNENVEEERTNLNDIQLGYMIDDELLKEVYEYEKYSDSLYRDNDIYIY